MILQKHSSQEDLNWANPGDCCIGNYSDCAQDDDWKGRIEDLAPELFRRNHKKPQSNTFLDILHSLQNCIRSLKKKTC